jgi:hypothetical protein
LVELWATIAATGAEHIAGEALAMDTDENLTWPGDVAADECEVVLTVGMRAV